MISPEVLNFAPPHSMQQCCIKNKTDLKKAIESGQYGTQFHAISLLVPGKELGEEIRGCFKSSVYYRVHDLPIHEFLDPSFMTSFVLKGSLIARTIHTWSDVEPSAIFQSGKLLLSVGKDIYQELGLNGHSSLTLNREVATYTITLDFSQGGLAIGSKYHQRVKWCLEKNPQLTFDWILFWEPQDEEICASSVAAYLDLKGFKVTQCKQQFEEWEEEKVKMPLISQDTETSDLVEWVGIATLHMSCIKVESALSTYATSWACPEPSVIIERINGCSWKGFLSIQQSSQILEQLLSLVSIWPWASITLHGFDDSPFEIEDVTSFFISDCENCKIFTSRTPRKTKVK